MAVVTHSGYLFNMLNAVVDCSKDPAISLWFNTGQIKSVLLTFHDNE